MFNLSLVQRPDGCYAMLSAQCGWLLSCFVITILQQRTQASATTSSTNTATSSMSNDHRQQNRPQKEQQTLDNKTSETDADAEAGVTCYTCVNVSDNLVCNRFAIDRPCPQGEDFCHTLHIMDSRGESVVVNKKCADQRECSPQHVGCLSIDRQTVCVSCCDEMYCNISVPSNQSTAVFSDSRTKARRRAQQYHNNSSNSNIGSQLLPSCSNSSSHLLIVVLLMMLMTTMLLAT